MALAAAVAGLVLVLEDVDLGAATVIHDLRGDRDLRQGGGIGGDLRAIHHEHRGQGYRTAGLAGHAVHDDEVADGDLLLPTAGTNDGVHE